MQNREEIVITPTMKSLMEKKAKSGKFYVPAIEFSSLLRVAAIGGKAQLVYSAIRATVKMRGQWSKIPTQLQSQIPLTSPHLSRAIRQLEDVGLIQVRRESGKKLRFALPETTPLAGEANDNG